MHNLTKTLLSSVAVGALTVAPAMAQQQKHPAFALTAMHAGRVVNKTKPYRCGHFSYTSCVLTVYTSVSASDFDKRVPLAGTFYKFNSNATLCSSPKTKIKAWRKSAYAKIGTGTETYSVGCPSGPLTFYGDTYKLNDKSGFGKADYFESMMSGKFKMNGEKYKGRLILEVFVAIGTERSPISDQAGPLPENPN